MEILIQLLLLVVGFFLLMKGADWFVDGASGIADRLGIPELVVGLTIVALGTSLPELVTSVTAAIKGKSDIAMGNIVGSNIFNILFVVGTSALIIPVTYSELFLFDGFVAIGTMILLFICVVKNKRLGRLGGVLMLMGYAGYFCHLISQ